MFFFSNSPFTRINSAPDVRLRIGICFLGYYLYLITNSYQTNQYYDANEYWDLAFSFFKHGKFSLLNYFSLLRGYSYPLLNIPFQGLRKFAHLPLMSVVKIQGAVWAALLFGWVLPAFWQQLSGNRLRLTWWNWSALVIAGFIFWRDHFSFTLSDFPAFTFLLIALFFVVKRRNLTWFAAGVSLAFAFNMRPVYTASIPFVVGLVFFTVNRSQEYNWKGRALFFVGLFVVILPQLLINIHQSDAYTPLVISKADVLGKRESLYEWHLAYGMRVQKFEVLVPPVGQYSLMCITEDPDGKALLVKVNDNQSFKKVSSYAEAVFREPVRFTALFGRHLFNGLDIRFASPYLWGGLVKTDSELR